MAYGDPTPRIVVEVSMRFPVTLAGAVLMGDLVGYSSGWKQAAAASTAIIPWFIALEDGASGDIINCVAVAIVTSVTDAAAGTAVYASATAGETTQSAPGGTRDKIVGIALSATSVLLAPSLYVTPVYA